MTVKDIIAIAFDFAGERDLSKKISSSAPLTSVEEEKLNSMLRYFNYVNQEIATDYLPFIVTEEIDVDRSILNFSTLSKNLISIYELKGRYNKHIRYKKYPNYIETFGHATKITYSYLPEDLTLESEFEFFNGLSARVYAYGLASEYLLCDGLGDDASIWEERFKESLFILTRKHTEMLLPKRNWF